MRLHHTQAKAIREAGCDFEITEAGVTLSANWRDAETFDDPRQAVLAAKGWAAQRLEDELGALEGGIKQLEPCEPTLTLDEPSGKASNCVDAAAADLAAARPSDEASTRTAGAIQKGSRRRYASRNGDPVCEAMNSCCDAAGKLVGERLVRFAEANSVRHSHYDALTPGGRARMRMSICNAVRARARKTGRFIGLSGEVLTWAD